MFTITIYELGNKKSILVKTTVLETLAETEILAVRVADHVFGVTGLELVYIDDLDYYIYSSECRLGRLTIQPIYTKRSVKK